MGTNPEGDNVVLTFNPWRPGLVTAGQQTSIPEDELWKAKNVGFDLDGMMSKRPGLEQWGQTVKEPDSSATGSTITEFKNFLSGVSGFTVADNSTSSVEITTSTSRGVLQTNVGEGSSNENYVLSHDVAALSVGSEWSVRFIFRGTNLPAYTTDDTDPNTFVVRGIGKAATGKEFAIFSDGIYWKRNDDSKYTKVTSSDRAGTGAWNSIEIRVDDAAGNTLVYLNDTLLQTLTSADLKDVTPAGTSSFEFRWEVEGTVPAALADSVNYTTHISTMMYNDTVTDPFIAQPVVALEEYQCVTTSAATVSSLVMSADNYRYYDRTLESG